MQRLRVACQLQYTLLATYQKLTPGTLFFKCLKLIFLQGAQKIRDIAKLETWGSFVPFYVPILIFAFVPESPYPAIPHRIVTFPWHGLK